MITEIITYINTDFSTGGKNPKRKRSSKLGKSKATPARAKYSSQSKLRDPYRATGQSNDSLYFAKALRGIKRSHKSAKLIPEFPFPRDIRGFVGEIKSDLRCRNSAQGALQDHAYPRNIAGCRYMERRKETILSHAGYEAIV